MVNFKMAFIDIARARVITKKNQSRITIFHLYFIKIKIRAKARAKEKTIYKNVGAGSSSGLPSPNGSALFVNIIFPVVGFGECDGV